MASFLDKTMPHLLIRHSPVRGRNGEAWLVEVDQLLPDLDQHLELLSPKQRRKFRVEELRVEDSFENLASNRVKKVEAAQNESNRDLWWPAYLIVAYLEVVYEVKQEHRADPKVKAKLGPLVDQYGGPDFLEKLAKKNSSRLAGIREQKALVDVVSVKRELLRSAVFDLVDEQDKVVVQILSDEDPEKAKALALAGAEAMEQLLQEVLDQGKPWEVALRSLRMGDKTEFRRDDLL